MPAPSSYTEIEGFKQASREAFERQQSIRERAFFALPERVCGERVRFITLRTYAALRWQQNAFVTPGKRIDIDDAISLLWVHSINWTADTQFGLKRRAKIARRLTMLDIPEIDDWVDQQFQDLSDGGHSKNADRSPPITCEILPIVDMIAREYHWSESEIVEMPIARIWQYRRLIKRHHNPDYKPMQLTDRVVDEYVAKWRDLKNV